MCRIYGKSLDTAYLRLCYRTRRKGVRIPIGSGEPWIYSCHSERLRDEVADMRDQEQLKREGVVY